MTRLQAVRLAGTCASVISTLLFTVVAWSVTSGSIEGFDNTLRTSTHAWVSDALTFVAFALSFAGSAPVWVTVTVVAMTTFWRLGWRGAAANLGLVMAGAIILENGLKLMFARARPEVLFGESPPTYSFPSGHAFYAACLYGALACQIADRVSSLRIQVALWTAAVLFAGAIGWSRIYLGVHYPSDVLAGYLAAASWIGLVTALRASSER